MSNGNNKIDEKKLNRIRKIERNKINAIPIEELNKLRQNSEEKKSNIKKEDDLNDFITMILVRWNFKQLITYTKILIVILNRNMNIGNCNINDDDNNKKLSYITSLLYYKYPCEYNETVFSEYTYITQYEPIVVNHEQNEEENNIIYIKKELSFKSYYNMIYKKSKELYDDFYLKNKQYNNDSEMKNKYITMIEEMKMLLKACFLISFTYDLRIKRFVLSKNDIHYKYLLTKPPFVKKAVHFLNNICYQYTNQFLNNEIPINEMTYRCIDIWIDNYMFIDNHFFNIF